MAINIQRDQRNTDFWKINTPNNIGPGLYLKENAGQFGRKRDV